MGRRAKELTADQKAQVEALAAYLSQDQIADYLGITRPTFSAMMDRDPEIALRYKRGKSKAVGLVAQGLLQKARSGDTTSAIFYLKTQAGWRETQKIEHTGADGAPIQVETLDVSKLSTETLAEIMAARDAAKTS
jgi:IS30 family transposase